MNANAQKRWSVVTGSAQYEVTGGTNNGILFGFDASCVLTRSLDGGRTWASANAVNANNCTVMQPTTDPNRAYANCSPTPQMASAMEASTSDGGNSWEYLARGMAVLAVDPYDSSHVFGVESHLGSYNFAGLFESRDAGLTWEVFLTTTALVGGVALGADANTLYVETADGSSLATHDAGAHWSVVSNLGRVVIAQDGTEYAELAGLFRSTDGGKTWQAVTSEKMSVLDIAPWDSGVLLASTYDEPHRYLWSNDSGLTWTDVTFNLPVCISRFVFDSNTKGILALGCGVFSATL